MALRAHPWDRTGSRKGGTRPLRSFLPASSLFYLIPQSILCLCSPSVWACPSQAILSRNILTETPRDICHYCLKHLLTKLMIQINHHTAGKWNSSVGIRAERTLDSCVMACSLKKHKECLSVLRLPRWCWEQVESVRAPEGASQTSK